MFAVYSKNGSDPFCLLAALRLELLHPVTGQRAAPDADCQRVLDQLGWGGIEIECW